ncbi:MAG: hypothetical protein AAF388_14420 [Bacteroidota bacterium]
MCSRRKHGGKKFLGGIFAVVVGGFLVKFLWNALIPDLFGGPFISFFQALGLLILSKILFSGGGCKGRGSCNAKGKMKHHWKEKIREKMKHMSPEEKEAFKKSFKGKWNRFDIEVFEVEDEEEEVKDSGDDQDKGDDAPPKSGRGRKKS